MNTTWEWQREHKTSVYEQEMTNNTTKENVNDRQMGKRIQTHEYDVEYETPKTSEYDNEMAKT